MRYIHISEENTKFHKFYKFHNMANSVGNGFIIYLDKDEDNSDKCYLNRYQVISYLVLIIIQ